MKIFISYRRADSRVHAELIYTKLAKHFGLADVFFDVEEIDLGDDFARIIEQRVGACDVLLAIIGPQWLTADDDQGRRRLHQPNDYVRHEIASALSRGIRVIPVRVRGAPIPQTEDLPEDIRALTARNMLEVREYDPDLDIERLIAQLKGHKSPTDWINEVLKRFELRRIALGIVPAVVLMMFFAAWTSLFDALTLDTKIERYTMWLGGLLSKRELSDQIAIIAIDKDAESRFGDFNETWRRHHAQLIEALSHSGARTIAFDMLLSRPSSYDAELISAIKSARHNGTAVIFGTEGAASPIPGFAESVTGLGLVCAATTLDTASAVPLAIKDKPHLTAFAVMAAYQGAQAKNVDSESRQIFLLIPGDGTERIKFSSSEHITKAHRYCEALEVGDEMALLTVEFSPLKLLRDPARRYHYAHVIANAEAAATDEGFKGKIVLVGREYDRDIISISRGPSIEQRYGFEVHADAISNLLQGTHIRPLDAWAQFFFMLAMGVLGAAARFVKARPLSRRILLIAAIAGYLAISMLLYVENRILLNPVYDIVAFFAAYWWLGRAARRLGLWEKD